MSNVIMVAATFRLRKERKAIAYKRRLKPAATHKDKNGQYWKMKGEEENGISFII